MFMHVCWQKMTTSLDGILHKLNNKEEEKLKLLLSLWETNRYTQWLSPVFIMRRLILILHIHGTKSQKDYNFEL